MKSEFSLIKHTDYCIVFVIMASFFSNVGLNLNPFSTQVGQKIGKNNNYMLKTNVINYIFAVIKHLLISIIQELCLMNKRG